MARTSNCGRKASGSLLGPIFACLTLLAFLTAGSAARAQAPTAQFSLGRGGAPHAGVPFELQLVVEGFDEQPAPAQPQVDIAGAKVASAGATPNTSHGIQIVNGRRTDSVRVTWVLRYRVEVAKEGQLRIPATTVTQGGKNATAPAGTIKVEPIASTDDMKLELGLPQRPVFVGETIPVKVTWLFRGDPSSPVLHVPLLGLDAVTVSTPPVADRRKAITLSGGQKELQLPYQVERATVAGVEYNRLTATFLAAPRSVGKVEVPPSSVLAGMAVGRRDFFGMSSTQLFRATDVARTLDVKPLPETDRPASFAGAVGEQFSIEVRTSRSVVQLGEPVELDIRIKSNQRLDALSLPPLDGPGGLPKDKFTAPADATGELSEDGTTKSFKVVAQVIGPATEIPAIALSYFDPAKSSYRTIHSEPIALSVKGGGIVGAGEVVGAPGAPRAKTPAPEEDTALVSADLALSSVDAVDDRPLGGWALWTLVAALYLIPLGALAFRTWQLGTARERGEASELRAARERVDELLERATSTPAREIAGPLGAALRELARASGSALDDGGVLAKLETHAYSPEARDEPLSAELRAEMTALSRTWSKAPRRTPAGKKAPLVAIVLGALALATHARADALSDGRAAYEEAMRLTTDATARRAAFAHAAAALAQAARERPGRAELLADWGNAALGGGDVATATLAYRRALHVDGSNVRARKNLVWLRGRQSDATRAQAGVGATDTLFFFHQWPRAHRWVVGAAMFALAILLLVPWSARGRRQGQAALSLLPLGAWLAMIASLVLEPSHHDDAVVMDGVSLRAADNSGAPLAMTQPLSRGTEVTLLELREAWARVRIASGVSGWIPAGAVERVTPR